MQIELPNDPKLEARAAAGGFSSVEEYVRSLIEQIVQHANEDEAAAEIEPIAAMRPDALSYTDWQNRLRAFVSRCPSTNPHFDDSRETMDPDRS